MKSVNQAQIQRAFTGQAAKFESSRMNFSNRDYLEHMVQKLAPVKTDTVLEVAAGTCACGRAIAPHAGRVVCMDMTPAMLSVGRAEAEKAKLDNITFVLGDAAELPFLDRSFDVVLSRLAFHHFPDVKQPFAEMARVLKPDGRLVLIDMEAAEEQLRATKDGIERLRDPSHVHTLSREEMLALYRENGLTVSRCEATKMPMVLQNWLEHTATTQAVQEQIRAQMQQELSGGSKTGFAPYLCENQIRFEQNWVMVIGRKEKMN